MFWFFLKQTFKNELSVFRKTPPHVCVFVLKRILLILCSLLQGDTIHHLAEVGHYKWLKCSRALPEVGSRSCSPLHKVSPFSKMHQMILVTLYKKKVTKENHGKSRNITESQKTQISRNMENHEKSRKSRKPRIHGTENHEKSRKPRILQNITEKNRIRIRIRTFNWNFALIYK